MTDSYCPMCIIDFDCIATNGACPICGEPPEEGDLAYGVLERTGFQTLIMDGKEQHNGTLYYIKWGQWGDVDQFIAFYQAGFDKYMNIECHSALIKLKAYKKFLEDNRQSTEEGSVEDAE